jgi:ketosteroid isomerase-like protein
MRAAPTLAVLIALALTPPDASPTAPGGRRAEVLAAVEAFAEAFRLADADRLAGMLAPGYLHTNTGGGLVERDAWLEYVRSRRLELDSGALALTLYENRDLDVRLHGDSLAIVTGVNLSAGTRDGSPFELVLRFTQVWVRTPDGWRRAAFHDTAVTK